MPKLDQPLHQEQYLDYRVTVYRLDFGKKTLYDYNKNLGDGSGEFMTINRVLGLDFYDPSYDAFAGYVNDHFPDVIMAINAAIRDGVFRGVSGLGTTQLSAPARALADGSATAQSTNPLADLFGKKQPAQPQPGSVASSEQLYKSLFTNSGIFKQYDITPLIAGVNTSSSIEGQNTCQLTMIDQGQSDFGLPQMSRYLSDFTQGRLGESAKPIVALSGKETNFLKNFTFKEFDFIRVSVYARTDVPVPMRMNQFSALQIPPDWVYVPQFTGLVTSIIRDTAVGAVPTISVSCAGMSRVLSQTVTVFSRAISQLVSGGASNGKKGDEKIRFLTGDMNVNANIFSGKHSEEIFRTLMKDTFFPEFVRSEVSSWYSLGVPNLSNKQWIDITQINGKEMAVQFLPTLVMYHILKYMNSEPIVVYDDRLGNITDFMSSAELKSRAQGSSQHDKAKMAGFLTPYLEMARTSYEQFDSQFMSPEDIFNEIRRKTFFEIFEDRSGAFHFRFPRFNEANIKHAAKAETTMAVNFEKTDSAVYNAVVSQPMMAWNGKIPNVAGAYYLDRLSILRYGMRMPQIEENPNSVSEGFAAKLSEFMRGYFSGRSARRATLTQLINPMVTVGDMVLFKAVGPYIQKDAASSGKSASSSEVIMVGYVTGIQETMSISGNCQQTLTLEYVRLASEYQIASAQQIKDAGNKKIDHGGYSYSPASASVASADASSSSTQRAISSHEASHHLVVPTPPSNSVRFDIDGAMSGASKEIVPRLRNMANKIRGTGPAITTSAESDYIILADSLFTDSTYARFKYVQDPADLAAASSSYLKEVKEKSTFANGSPENMSDSDFAGVINAKQWEIRARSSVVATYYIIGQCAKGAQERLTIGLLRGGPKNFVSAYNADGSINYGQSLNDFWNLFSRNVNNASNSVWGRRGGKGSTYVTVSPPQYQPVRALVTHKSAFLDGDYLVQLCSYSNRVFDGKSDVFVSEWNRIFKSGSAGNTTKADLEIAQDMFQDIIAPDSGIINLLIDNWDESGDIMNNDAKLQQLVKDHKQLVAERAQAPKKIGGARPVSRDSAATDMISKEQNTPTSKLDSKQPVTPGESGRASTSGPKTVE